MLNEFEAKQLALRHVQEGRARIARQKALIQRLRDHGHGNLLNVAERILQWMEGAQLMFEADLAEKRGKARLVGWLKADRLEREQHLSRIEEFIAQVGRYIAEVRERIDEAQREGRDASNSLALLKTLEETQALQIAGRARLVEELSGNPK